MLAVTGAIALAGLGQRPSPSDVQTPATDAREPTPGNLEKDTHH